MSQSLSEKLIADAELEAERILGILRMTVALTLLVWINASLQLDQRARPNPDFENTQTVTIALGGFFFIGLASFILARVHLFRSWMAFVFTAIDAATLSLGLYAILAST